MGKKWKERKVKLRFELMMKDFSYGNLQNLLKLVNN